MKIRFKILIYLAVFLLPYDALNLPNISILDRKPISLFLCGLFVLFNVDRLLNTKINKREAIFFCATIASFVIGFMKINMQFNNDYTGIKTSLNSIMGFFIVYFAFKIYFYNCKKDRFDKMVTIAYKGYITITLISGILQIIYIRLFQIPALEKVFEMFLFNNLNYIKYGRIHFMVSEPSFVGGYFYLIFIPCSIYLYKSKRLNKNIFIFSLLTFGVMNILSFSNRFIIDSVVFLVIFMIIITKNKHLILKYFSVITIVVLVCVFNVVFINNIFNIKNDNLDRIEKIFTQNSLAEDQSFLVRRTLLITALDGFKDKPITGYGNGTYKYVLRDKFVPTRNIKANDELVNYMNSDGAVVTYSFYTTTLVESGLIGLIIILCVINTCLMNRYRNNRLVLIIGMYILYTFIQNEFNSYLPIVIYLAMFNSNINLKKVDEKNENIDNYSVL